METPFFSVVVPAFNRAGTIRATLESVMAQSFPDFECIVVDDGSEDGAELAAVVQGLDDRRFRYIRRENGGGGAARNTGVEAAKGAYIAFLDSDDHFLPEKLAVCSAAIRLDPDAIHYSFMYVDRGVGKFWLRPDRPIAAHEDVGEYLFVANQFIQTSTIVMSKAWAHKVPFNPTLRKGQDLDLCVRLAAAGARFSMIEQPLTIWVDQTEVGRTSRVSGHKAPSLWLEANKAIMTKKAVSGYRATVLAYYLGWSAPLTVATYLLQGLRAGVPVKVILRQALRTYLPRKAYRNLVAIMVSFKGTTRKD